MEGKGKERSRKWKVEGLKVKEMEGKGNGR